MVGEGYVWEEVGLVGVRKRQAWGGGGGRKQYGGGGGGGG